MFTESRRMRRRASLDLSPLIDIVFQLVIFFAVTTTFLEEPGLKLELPESTTAAPEALAPVVVTVDADGTIRFRNRTLTPAALERAVSALPEAERAEITLRADRRVQYGVLVQVFDALRRAGATGLSLPMEFRPPEEAPPGAGPGR